MVMNTKMNTYCHVIFFILGREFFVGMQNGASPFRKMFRFFLFTP